MVNMRMETRSVNPSQSQDTPAALTSELGADAELVQHTQQLGELPCLALPAREPYSLHIYRVLG